MRGSTWLIFKNVLLVEISKLSWAEAFVQVQTPLCFALQEAVRVLLKASQLCDKQTGEYPINLAPDICFEIVAKMAYPISAWIH